MAIEKRISKKYDINFEITDEFIADFKRSVLEEKKKTFKITPKNTIKSIEQLKKIILNSYDIKDNTLLVGIFYSCSYIVGLKAIGETRLGEWINIKLDINRTYYFHDDNKTFYDFKPEYGEKTFFKYLKEKYDNLFSCDDYYKIFKHVKRLSKNGN